MYIDYVLTEKCEDASMSAKKGHIREHIKVLFPSTTSKNIIIQLKHKEYKLPYSITCTSATDNCSNDFVYSIHLEYESSNNLNSAHVLEKAHLGVYDYFSKEKEFHLIIANDGLSEYYCNKAYPKFQKFERLLRNLIFIVVAKAYGEKWVDETLPKDLKPKINKNQLIESALAEMTLGELIAYLFYGQTEVIFPDYIDENYPSEKLHSMSKDDLLLLIEKGRPKSVWNNFLAKLIHVQQPKEKLNYLRDNRNKIAHCKQFYAADYKQSMEYLDSMIPQIDECIEKVSIKDNLSARDIVLGFGNFTLGLSEYAKQLGQAITPAITQMAELGQSFVKAIQESLIQIPVNPAIESLRKIVENTNAISNSFDFSAISAITQITSSMPTIPSSSLLMEDKQEDLDNDSAERNPNIKADEENKDNGSNK